MNWRELAERRVNSHPELKPYWDVIFYDWPEQGHLEWIATVPSGEIVHWASGIIDGAWAIAELNVKDDAGDFTELGA